MTQKRRPCRAVAVTFAPTSSRVGGFSTSGRKPGSGHAVAAIARAEDLAAAGAAVAEADRDDRLVGRVAAG